MAAPATRHQPPSADLPRRSTTAPAPSPPTTGSSVDGPPRTRTASVVSAVPPTVNAVDRGAGAGAAVGGSWVAESAIERGALTTQPLPDPDWTGPQSPTAGPVTLTAAPAGSTSTTAPLGLGSERSRRPSGLATVASAAHAARAAQSGRPATARARKRRRFIGTRLYTCGLRVEG